MSVISRIEGAALPLPGDDIDTDRIIPARFLVSVTFEGLEKHVFADDRKARADTASPHPFDDPNHAGASILIVNRNFGCGSSREHAPQALLRWGIRAIVGESFSGIFLWNSVALGLPCVTAPHAVIAELQATASRDDRPILVLDLFERKLRAGDTTYDVTLPDPAREAFLSGHWDPTSLLLDRYEEIEAVARNLPYVSGF